MDDTFFGFDTSLPVDDDGGGGLEDSETDYDALNDETFGKAINGDWENSHENYVRLDKAEDLKTDNANTDASSDADADADADLDFNLSRLSIDDFDVAAEESEARVQLDPSVWANPFKSPTQNNLPANLYGLYRTQDVRQNIPNSMSILSRQQLQMQPSTSQPPPSLHHPAMPHKIMTVEDIERNIRNQQKQSQNSAQQKTEIVKPQTPQHHNQQQLPQQLQQQQQQQLLQQQQQQLQLPPPPQLPSQRNVQNTIMPPPQFPRPTIPPGMPPPKGTMFPPQHQLPLTPGQPKPPARLPPGFPPMPLMGPPHHMSGGPMGNNLPRPMPHNLPVALNNFAMHPNFNAIRQNMPPPRMPPHLQQSHFQTNVHNMQTNINQFNQRLVQEIQQNHPMLPFNRLNNMYNNNMVNPHHMNMMHQNMHNMHNGKQSMQQQQQQQQQQHNQQQQQQQNHHQQMRANGNMNEGYDEYANLMSTRDKQWLISIQLSQVNTDTPYIDDYYYTVFKERKTKSKGQSESKAHKDNQLNHPFSQPKGHVQLVLNSMNNKNGNNQRNGQNIRERRTSESNKDKEQSPRTYTPLQFENSLGKLQCGSVTAPRKIIDMEVMGSDGTNPFNATLELSAQRKSRQLLLHIETMYRIILKMEDLENPTAIATSLIVKERKDKERQNLLEQLAPLDNLETKDNEGNLNLDSIGNSLRSSIALSEEEGYDELLPKLLAGLSTEKVTQMMSVRKGRNLLKRAMPLIKDHTYRWDLWYAIFSVLPIIVKKDKDDAEHTLFCMFAEFKNQIQDAKMLEIIKLGNCLILSEKKIVNILQNKFCISCIIILILRAEFIHTNDADTINLDIQNAWLSFLSALTNSLSNNSHIHSAIIGASTKNNENDIVKSIASHLCRFKEIKTRELLAVLAQDLS